MILQNFPRVTGAPLYAEPVLYLTMRDRTIPWQFNGWRRESLSWKTGCYIHSGLSGWRTRFSGTDALRFWQSICVNGFSRFEVGSLKHAVMCTQEGLIAAHAVLQRDGENDFSLMAAGFPWAEYQALKSGMNVSFARDDSFIHQVAGPTSLATLERAAGESLADIRFLRFRLARIAGVAVEIARVGMSGNLAYEVRGAGADAEAVYDAIYRAGAGLGIERLGWGTYFVNHVEGGFPQATWTFFSAALDDQSFRQRMIPDLHVSVSGSVDPAAMRARYRTPSEVGWQSVVRLDHDFIGRQAVEAEMANPRRTIVTLRWNADDVLDVMASLFRPGREYKPFDFPVTPSWQHGFNAHADHVLQQGSHVGISSGTIYSYHYREMLSMATVDLEAAGIGTQVEVLWGDHGEPVKTIRATVAGFPYLAEGRNSAG